MNSKLGAGVIFITAGVFVTWGSLTGSLAPMLAALINPKILVPNPNSSGAAGSASGDLLGGAIVAKAITSGKSQEDQTSQEETSGGGTEEVTSGGGNTAIGGGSGEADGGTPQKVRGEEPG